MSTAQLNNLWAYIDGMSLKKKDREWLADKLLIPSTKELETLRQQEYVKESLTRALQEVQAAKREGRQLKSVDVFLADLELEETV